MVLLYDKMPDGLAGAEGGVWDGVSGFHLWLLFSVTLQLSVVILVIRFAWFCSASLPSTS